MRETERFRVRSYSHSIRERTFMLTLKELFCQINEFLVHQTSTGKLADIQVALQTANMACCMSDLNQAPNIKILLCM